MKDPDDTVELHKCIVEISMQALREQHSDGSMPAGHNGPYADPETPVRNTAHWLYTFSYLYETDGDKIWAEAAERCGVWLLSEKARPMDAAFHCRSNPNKDFSNGLIGQAWALEGLLKAAQVFNTIEYVDAAKNLVLQHPFNEEYAIWHILNVDGSKGSIDMTFNHQLWFAAVAAEIKEPEINRCVKLFFDNVASHVQIYNDGIIRHLQYFGRSRKLEKVMTRHHAYRVKQWLWQIKHSKVSKQMYLKSVGYHAFNLVAFANLNAVFPKHLFWSSRSWEKILGSLNNPDYINALDRSEYSWTYNPPGPELAYLGEVLNWGHSFEQSWMQLQTERTYEYSPMQLLTRGSLDRATSVARTYEATKLRKRYLLRIKSH